MSVGNMQSKIVLWGWGDFLKFVESVGSIHFDLKGSRGIPKAISPPTEHKRRDA